jgi:hypothetical protein
MTGDQGKLPYETEKNTAGMAVLRLTPVFDTIFHQKVQVVEYEHFR